MSIEKKMGEFLWIKDPHFKGAALIKHVIHLNIFSEYLKLLGCKIIQEIPAKTSQEVDLDGKS